MSSALRVGLALGSGLLCALAFPLWDIGPIAFFGLVPLFLAVEETTPWQATWLGYGAGLTFYLAIIWWVINTMTTYGQMSLPLSLVALLLLCGVLAGYWAAFAGLFVAGRRSLGFPPGVEPLVAAGLWVALEFLRTYLFSGFPWAVLGYTQYRQPTVRLLASAVGVYGISAVLLLVNGTLARLVTVCLEARGGPVRWRAAVFPVGVAALAILTTVAYGRLLWHDRSQGVAIRMALLQGNIDQSLKWDQRYQTETLNIYERLVRRVAADRPDLIVWPETAVPFFLRRGGELSNRVFHLTEEIGIPMLVGSPDIGDDGQVYNTAFLVGKDGQIRGRYDKRHLVPFGEYVPLHQIFFFLDKLAVGIGELGRGQQASVFSLDGSRFSVAICYEVIFPGEVREFVRNGAGFLVNITNDAWFGRSGAPAQHLAMAAMRAVENGTYLIRAANTGITAIIAPTGQILAHTDIFTEAILSGTIQARQGETPYTRYGDVLAWVALVFLAAYVLALVRAGWNNRMKH
ncbi:MAG TPA: apolipoprotein N-acyltransferase [Candidatus Methylomirabilis sp.]|nr:apolipoprotein N-acyltransferase [Candidatus Methylomirabilis sp.]